MVRKNKQWCVTGSIHHKRIIHGWSHTRAPIIDLVAHKFESFQLSHKATHPSYKLVSKNIGQSGQIVISLKNSCNQLVRQLSCAKSIQISYKYQSISIQIPFKLQRRCFLIMFQWVLPSVSIRSTEDHVGENRGPHHSLSILRVGAWSSNWSWSWHRGLRATVTKTPGTEPARHGICVYVMFKYIYIYTYK